jgi:hypothetical protein
MANYQECRVLFLILVFRSFFSMVEKIGKFSNAYDQFILSKTIVQEFNSN